MFGFFKKSEKDVLQKKYNKTLTEAMNFQRSGNIQEYARLSSEANLILDKINELASREKS